LQRKLLASVVLSTLVCLGTLGLALGVGWSPKLGLDLRGGVSVVYKPERPVSQTTLQTVANIITARANGLGVAQPNVTTQGGDVVVQLPGAKNASEILNVIGRTAQMYFRPVLCAAPPFTPAAATSSGSTPYRTPPDCSPQYRYTNAYFDSATQGYNPPPPDPSFATFRTLPATATDDPTKNVILAIPGSSYRYVLGPSVVDGTVVNGTIVKSATAELSQTQGWIVVMSLTGRGSPVFNALAGETDHALLANDLDGDVISAPVILNTNFNGSVEISGLGSEQAAKLLALDLTYGSLPVNLSPQTEENVSASLGHSALVAGVSSGVFGLGLVMAYTIAYYRALGAVVVLGLMTTAAFLYGLISALGASSLGLTLDLSGITGLIVSVGITVDSYVVYFERLKDEIRAGRSVRASVDRGFRSAYRTILSADAVSFIGALVLWILSVGDVKGFAFMLGLSTLTDVVTAYVFTRPLVILLGRSRPFTEARWIGVARGLARGPQ
jgi:preprotein translocase subunit SecD